jgi:hypothetical protein
VRSTVQKDLQLEMDMIAFLASKNDCEAFAKKFHGVDYILVIMLEGDDRQERLLQQAKQCGVLEKITLISGIHHSTWSNPDSNFMKYSYKGTDKPEGATVSSSGMFWMLNPKGDCPVRRAGLCLEAVNAITNTTTFQTWSRMNYRDNRKEVACSLSHMLAITFAEEMGYCPLMVVESDSYFLAAIYWNYSLKEVMDTAPKGWGCISLNNTMLGDNAQLRRRFLRWSKNLKKDGKTCWGTQSVLYSKTGIEWMTKHFDKKKSAFKLNCSDRNQRELDYPHFDGIASRIPDAFVANSIGMPSDQGNVGNSAMHPWHNQLHGEAALDLLVRLRKMKAPVRTT